MVLHFRAVGFTRIESPAFLDDLQSFGKTNWPTSTDELIPVAKYQAANVRSGRATVAHS